MPRGKKTNGAATSAPDAGIETGTTPVAVIYEPPPAAEAGSSESGADATQSEGLPQAGSVRGRFRSWVVDARRGYTGLTDEVGHSLVLQFAEKPQPDVLLAVKDAGFQFRPDYHGLKSVWVRRNDFEGRLQVETIEKLLKGASVEQEVTF